MFPVSRTKHKNTEQTQTMGTSQSELASKSKIPKKVCKIGAQREKNV